MKPALKAKQISLALIGSSFLIFGVAEAAQALKLFSDRAVFDSTVTNQTNIDFEGLAAPRWFAYYPTGLTQAGVNFTGSSGNLFVVDPDYSPGFYDWGSGAVLSYQRGTTLTAALPSGINAVGSDIMSFSPFASEFIITLSSGETFNIPSFNRPNRAFFGVVADIPISSISFRAAGTARTQLDNFVFGRVEAAPIPTPALLPGLVGMGIAALRRRRAKPPEDDGSSSSEPENAE